MRELRDRLMYPRAGWLSLGLLFVMALSVAWSVQGAEWLDQMDFLAPVALWAVLIGALLGMLRGSIVFALPVGAVLGAGVVLWAIGGEYYPEVGQLARLMSLRTEHIDWLRVVLTTGFPTEMAPYAIGLGVLMFATSFAAAHAVYRHHRVLDAILLMGAAMITNMSATLANLFGHMLLFVVAALLLWLRAALVDRQDGWQRRRVNENLEVPAAIMRSGILFAGGSIFLAWVLTAVAVAAPLTDAWRSFDGVWTGVRDQFEGVFGTLTNPQSRISGNTFGPSFIVQGEWVSVDEEVMVLAAPRSLYLRTTTYDIYTGRGWDSTPGERRQVEPGANLFDVRTSERPTATDGVRVERVGVEMRQTMGRDLFTAGSPLRIFAPSVVVEPDSQPLLGQIEHASALAEGEAYEMLVAISTATEAQLAAAGTQYPEEVTDRYLDVRGVTDETKALAARIVEGAESNYEKARRLATYLSRDPSFTYETDPPDAEDGQDLVDFFLFDEASNRSGYCQHYASAMVVMARSLGIPARLAAGFAPGERQDDDTFLIREANAHAWAEIYFPGYGWEIFEATKSINPRFGRASGDPNNLPQAPQFDAEDPLLDEDLQRRLGADSPITALPSPNFVDGAVNPSEPDAVATDDGESSQGANALLIVALILGAGAFLWFRMRQMQRKWRLLPAGDRAWNQLTTAAGRAGVGPRPSETIYEYSGWLEEQLPGHAEPIRVVADGKVWQSYSGRRLTVSGGHKLEAALRRLQRPLTLLAARRWLRRVAGREGSR